jgi:hypothetical protein
MSGGVGIVTDLPPSGSGSEGDVIVTVRNHNSNVARLTEWRGTFQYGAAGAGTINMNITFDVAFRADIRQYRPMIHDPPWEPSSGPIAQISPESSATFACGGTYTITIPNGTTTYTLTGSGALLEYKGFPTAPPPGPNSFFVVNGLLFNHELMNA